MALTSPRWKQCKKRHIKKCPVEIYELKGKSTQASWWTGQAGPDERAADWPGRLTHTLEAAQYEWNERNRTNEKGLKVKDLLLSKVNCHSGGRVSGACQRPRPCPGTVLSHWLGWPKRLALASSLRARMALVRTQEALTAQWDLPSARAKARDYFRNAGNWW